jgi:hypothetical protein
MAADEITCCNDEQHVFLYLYVIYVVGIILLRDTFLFKPMRLLATSIHEISHAAVCWLTGGRVLQLQVYENEGGVTRYRGGLRWLIAPAGYLGEAVWGVIFTVCSGGRRTATAAALLLVAALLISLCYSPNRILVFMIVIYSSILLGLIYVEWKIFDPILQFAILFFGVFLSMSALLDIFSHLVWRSQPGSDAYTLYEESRKCFPPRCIGFVWLVMALLLQVTGVYLALILMSDACRDKGWFGCTIRSKLNFQLDLPKWDWWPDNWVLLRQGP